MITQAAQPARTGITWEESVSRMWENVHNGTDRNVPYDSTIMEQTPDALFDMGFPDIPWAHDWKNLRKECTPQRNPRDIANHGVPFDALVRLPELLSEPVAAYVRPQYRNRINLVLDAESEMGVPLVACMSMDGTYRAIDGMQRPCVRVLTVHGRNNIADNLEMSGKAGLLVSVDIPRLIALFSRCGIEMPKGLARCVVNPDAFPYGSCWDDDDIDAANAKADMEADARANSRNGYGSNYHTVSRDGINGIRRDGAGRYGSRDSQTEYARDVTHGSAYVNHMQGRDVTFDTANVSEEWNDVMGGGNVPGCVIDIDAREDGNVIDADTTSVNDTPNSVPSAETISQQVSNVIGSIGGDAFGNGIPMASSASVVSDGFSDNDDDDDAEDDLDLSEQARDAAIAIASVIGGGNGRHDVKVPATPVASATVNNGRTKVSVTHHPHAVTAAGPSVSPKRKRGLVDRGMRNRYGA